MRRIETHAIGTYRIANVVTKNGVLHPKQLQFEDRGAIVLP